MLPVVILNAGRGSRLGPLTDDRPKCLVDVAGRPFIEWQLDWLRQQGVRQVYIATGYRGDQIVQHIERNVLGWGLQIHWSHDGPKILGSARSLSRILRLSHFPPKTGTFVLYGDILPRCALADVEAAFWQTDRTVLLTAHPASRPNGNVWMSATTTTYDRFGGPEYSRRESGLIAAAPAALDVCGVHRDLEDVLMMLSRRQELSCLPVDRPLHIGSSEGLRDATEALASTVTA